MKCCQTPREEEEREWLAQNKPDIINTHFQDKALPKQGMTWMQVNLAFKVNPDERADCVFSLSTQLRGYQVRQDFAALR
jgi:hypothetical protein